MNEASITGSPNDKIYVPRTFTDSDYNHDARRVLSVVNKRLKDSFLRMRLLTGWRLELFDPTATMGHWAREKSTYTH